NAMNKKATGFVFLACSALLGFSVAGGAWAADLAKLTETCANCHGKDGASTESDVPIIGGVSAEYLKGQLVLYSKKDRPCPETEIKAGPKKGTKTDMCQVTKELSDTDIKDLAGFYAGKKFVRAKQKFDAGLAAKGKEIHEASCEKCHSNGGSVASDDAGILAGQWMPYLAETFKQYSSGKRNIEEKKMRPKIEKLDKAGFDALTNYYGSFQ
ncbi:MAG TPA: c-type cytochrome, partial [Burkholderiales bacterium]|nr:c-type cytochrome [Burkholderiales bacterium]